MPPSSLTRLYWAIALLTFWLASVGHAEVLVLGVSSEYVYNSNFFAGSNNQDAANSFLVGPTFDLSDDEGRLVYDLVFNGAYQAYVDQSGVDAWESRLRARAAYELDARTSVRVTERFRDVSNLRFSRQDIALADTALDPNQNRYFRNDLELELIRALTRLLELRIRGAHHWIDFRENIDRNDSQAFEVGSELSLQPTATHDVGAGVTYTYQDFQQALSRFGSRGDSVTGYPTWTWNVTDQIAFRANGGPSWIRSNEDDTMQTTQTRFVGGSRGGDILRANIGSCDVDPVVGLPVASNCDLATPGAPGIPSADLGPLESFALATGRRVDETSELTFFGGASIGARLCRLESAGRLLSTPEHDLRRRSGFESRPTFDRDRMGAAGASLERLRRGHLGPRETLTEATFVDFTVISGPSGEAQRDVAFTAVEDRAVDATTLPPSSGYGALLRAIRPRPSSFATAARWAGTRLHPSGRRHLFLRRLLRLHPRSPALLESVPRDRCVSIGLGTFSDSRDRRASAASSGHRGLRVHG